MPQAVSGHPFTAWKRIQSQASPCDICYLKIVIGTEFLPVFCFSLSLSFHQCSILIFNYTLLVPEGEKDKGWEPSKKETLSSEIGKHWIEDHFHNF
jgi:hypothetical protein